jgi:4-hydroxy-2-oxoheptanedioate aldolase
MYDNKFKAALAQRKPQIGLWLSLANGYTTEICATAGFDWLLIDGEHAPNDLRSTLEQLQVVAPYRSHPVVRPVSGDVNLIKHLLDIGAQTLLVPMVNTAEQARHIVSAMRYPPHGIRGVGSGAARVSRWGLRTDYVDRADAEACLLVQAESRQALENLEAICAVDGVDGVFIGPADLAASLGHRGKPGHPEVLQAIEDAIKRIVASGKAAGILTFDNALARRYLELGCTFVAVGVEATLLAGATRALCAEFLGAGGEHAAPSTGSVY